MKRTLEGLGNVAGLGGVTICAVAGIARIVGFIHLGGFELMTLFIGGMGLMLGACLAKLHVLGSGDARP